jgi:hypothetical protein
LELKHNHLTFFTNEEILPNPNLDFGKVKNPYLSLKIKFLQGEQKILRVKLKEQKQQEKAAEIKEKKYSVLTSLVEFGEETLADDNENKLSLSYLTCSLDQWTQLDILKN